MITVLLVLVIAACLSGIYAAVAVWIEAFTSPERAKREAAQEAYDRARLDLSSQIGAKR